ncbi:hypothetical protein RJT34_16321 [Clitoria ternatea]|uniref:Uncharacterized protein n=1 Tax=Clitoria ternatea TaxID=43366 RepID=A0AAN9J6Z6_CLITE
MALLNYTNVTCILHSALELFFYLNGSIEYVSFGYTVPLIPLTHAQPNARMASPRRTPLPMNSPSPVSLLQFVHDYAKQASQYWFALDPHLLCLLDWTHTCIAWAVPKLYRA